MAGGLRLRRQQMRAIDEFRILLVGARRGVTADGIDDARRNEAMAEIVGKYPGRFAAFAVIPHGDIESSLSEIAYALDILKLDGICTTTNIRGQYLGDELFNPWLEELHRREAVLFVHPTMPEVLNPASPPLIEFCFDSTRMVLNMVLFGAKRRYGGIKIISTHGGGSVPYISRRFETLQPLVDKRAGVTMENLQEDLRSFYYDLTSCMGAVPLAAITRFVDPSRLLMGFDLPYAPVHALQSEIARFSANPEIGADAAAMICSENAVHLFPRLVAG
jgi:predicted TIM-barrel fold metal-dependent hydrolase